MSYKLDVPILAKVIDYPYIQNIPALTPTGIYNITRITLPYNTFGQVVLIENQSPTNANDIAAYIRIDDNQVPREFITQDRPFTKEDREYSIFEYIHGGSYIDINYNLITSPLIDIQAIIRLSYWYVDLALLEQLKHNPKIKPYWEIYRIMVENNKGK